MTGQIGVGGVGEHRMRSMLGTAGVFLGGEGSFGSFASELEGVEGR